MAQDLPVPQPNPAEISGRADDILSRAEFRQTESFLERASRWIDELLSDIVGGLTGGGVGTLVSWLILVALVGALAWVVVRMSPVGALTRVADAEAVVATRGPSATEHRSAAEWRAEAERLATEGRYDEAIRARYRALLADLIQRGLVDDVAGRTAGEYRREVETVAPPAAAASFGAATDVFQDVWYGPVRADRSELDRFTGHELSVVATVAS